MEDKNKQIITSSTLISHLFGSKESHPSISEILDSTQAPKVSGREIVQSEVNGKTKNETLNSKIDSQDEIFKGYGGEAHNKKNKDMSWMCEDQQVQPCSLSSSIYYGGQDIYPPPKSTQNSAFNPYKRSEGDNSQMATRGDWWEGML
ncbi:hypothetical protein P8452_35627 [Trifolium repens]|nr:hypothetical protein P8452_35627 [Trifolium repens]